MIRLIILSIAILTYADSSENVNGACISPFRIVIDAGSTGSRLHIFEFITTSNEISCERRGSSKAWTPLAAFADDTSTEHPLNATHVAHHMLPLFDYASIIIPQEYHTCTSVTIAATAGMRLLSLQWQKAVYDALYEGLVQYTTAPLEKVPESTYSMRFTFTSLQRKDVYTLNGEREGFYGAVAANYLRGVINAELRVIVRQREDDDTGDDETALASSIGVIEEGEKTNDGLCTNKFGMCEQDAENVVFGPSRHYTPQKHHDVKVHGPLGALDMGGSSTQIVYQSKSDGSSNIPVQNSDVSSHLHHDDFYAVSYLSYGADQFRIRLWNLWVDESLRRKESSTQTTENAAESNVIVNPCSFVGYQVKYRGHTLLGSGNAIQCSKEVNRLIPYHDNTIDLEELYDENMELLNPKRKLVGGIEHPPIRGKFYGMSLYFFTLDCLRELSDADHPIRVSWPTPSIEELTHALDTFCARNWRGDLEDVQHEAHEHTRAEVLPHRCIEAVYMVTLLRDGFGFQAESRDITFTQYVQGNEVEWSLGLALYEFAEEKRLDPAQESEV